jgi:hypothetical protein
LKRRWITTAAVASAAVLLIPNPSWAAKGRKPRTMPPAVAAVSVPPGPTTDCSGYVERRQFVDAQGWWTQTPGGTGQDFGHVHIGACIPERETVNGIIPFNIRVVLHDNPSTLRYVGIVIKGSGYEYTIAKPTIPNFTCPVGTCTAWITYNLDTNRFPVSGRQEIRFRGLLNSIDGNSMHGGINFQVNVANGKAKKDFGRLPYLRGKGWYTGAGYCEATMVSVPIPDAPLSGVWSPTVKLADHGDAGDNPVTHHTVRLDADFHAGIPGTILRDAAGSFSGAVSIDTRKLANGTHKLLLKSDCDDIRGSTNSGVLVIPFDVRN